MITFFEGQAIEKREVGEMGKQEKLRKKVMAMIATGAEKQQEQIKVDNSTWKGRMSTTSSGENQPAIYPFTLYIMMEETTNNQYSKHCKGVHKKFKNVLIGPGLCIN